MAVMAVAVGISLVGQENYHIIDDVLLKSLCQQAQSSPRRRSHLNLHADYSDPVQRVVIALAQGTYVRPHMHPQEHKGEMIMGVKGRSLVLIFEEQGAVCELVLLQPGETFGVEIRPGCWHTVLPLESETVIMEVKQGPFDPNDRIEFASWAPEEGEQGVGYFLEWCYQAKKGEQWAPV